ncbi:MAG: hypothetical protein ABL901_00850 [Hyphomicrobiaceae bacterium]
MIITYTTNAQGHARVYLGGKSSLECWIEPASDGIAWAFHLNDTPCGLPIADADKRTWATHTLMQLADALNVHPAELASVPFETITALHIGDPFLHTRMPVSRRPNKDFAFIATTPHMTRPAAHDTATSYARHRR